MTKDQAKDILRSYPCVCPYGNSPFNCGDEVCVFGEAIKTLIDDEKDEAIE